jgi:hypothetical protein
MLVQSPTEMAHHPIFWFDSRRIHYARQLWRYSWDMLVRVHVILLITLFVLAGIALASGSLRSVQFTLESALGMAIVVIILADGGIDFASISAGLPTLSGEIVNGRWDLLRLTALNDWGIVRAKHAGVRLRVWRATAIVVSVRIATIVLGIIIIYLLPFVTQGYNVALNGLLDTFRNDPLATLLALIVAAITLLVYVVEPIWRMQAMTAVGMWLSSRIMNGPLAMLAGFALILVTWILQALTVLALVFGLGSLSSGLLFLPYADSSSDWLLSIYLLFCCIITALTIYGFYALLQSFSLRRVVRRIRPMN